MIRSESKKAKQTLHSIKVVLFDLKSYILRNICIFRYKVHYNTLVKSRLCKRQMSSLYNANVVFVQGKCRLCISQSLFFHNVQRHLFLQSINKTNRRKSKFLNKKVIVCDLEWPLRSYLILWKICIFTILLFIEIFNKCARKKKLKTRSPEVFFLQYIEELTFLIIQYTDLYHIYKLESQKENKLGLVKT